MNCDTCRLARLYAQRVSHHWRIHNRAWLPSTEEYVRRFRAALATQEPRNVGAIPTLNIHTVAWR